MFRSGSRSGWFVFIRSGRGWKRRSVAVEEPVEESKVLVAESSGGPEEAVAASVGIKAPGTPTGAVAVEPREAPSLKIPAKKKEKRKRHEVEELPEHLQRLKGFERKLPGLESVRSLVVKPTDDGQGRRIGAVSAGRIEHHGQRHMAKKAHEAELPILLEPQPIPDQPIDWSPGAFVNPDRGWGHQDLHMTLEVLKTFISRPPMIRKTDGSIVIFLDTNNAAVYFRIPPENGNCWLAWVPEEDIKALQGSESFLTEGEQRAKYSQKGYWWATQKFRGPKGNWKDRNVLEGVQIVAKIIDLMDKQRKQ